MSEARLHLTPHYSVSSEGMSVDLTPFEGRLLTAMAFAPELSAEEATEILWPDPDHMPECWLNQITNIMARLRAKLRPFGWSVKVRYGFGWRLEKHGNDHGTAQAQTRQAA